jgi:HlyD family secretion protein
VSRACLLLALVAAAGCERDAGEPPPAAPVAATVPGLESVLARTQAISDTVRAFATVAGDSEPADVRDARTQLAEATARATLAAQQLARLDALTRGGVAPMKELEAARAEHATATAAVTRARATLAAFGADSPGPPLARGETWVIAQAMQDDVPRIRRGAEASFTVAPGLALAGRVEAAPAYVSPVTRTAPVRLRVRDPDHALRPGMAGAATILAGDTRMAVVVPMAAILQDGAATVVMVDDGAGHYERRPVQAGATADGWTEMRAGVTAGTRVVTTGAASLLSASRLPAGGEVD